MKIMSPYLCSLNDPQVYCGSFFHTLQYERGAMQSALNQLAKRTNGDVYIGVVGPVRVGKSTLITKLLDHLVVPSIEEGEEWARVIDEMPQSSAGLEIMTTEPKFIPSQAILMPIQGSNIHMKFRFVDCVGYILDSIGNHDKLI
ncbi:hypothetical protein CQS04_02560 [Chryseomicrobium excrementi]|uniref:Stage IV sporulation protein A ATPase domain-containing protein n=1 Tax=Chryseomicrobium excrementi TaxID=2041346 RepID=A0A2M9F2U3_9BACL|nr:hypothetical protein CQS04_02560 [Chryseomicrobium excrementi]